MLTANISSFFKKIYRVLLSYKENMTSICDDQGFVAAELSRKMLGKNVSVGRWTYVGYGSSASCWMPNTKVEIGKFCSIADHVRLLAYGEHGHKVRVSTYPLRTKLLNETINQDDISKGPIIIGNDVWIGTRAIILSGVTVGDGAVIGAGTVVAKDIPPYAIVVGNPVKIVGYRFSEEVIMKLLNIKWWDWPDKKIINSLPDFYKDVNSFVEKYYKNSLR